MSKHVDDLNRVFLELRDRYGPTDSTVVEVKEELDACVGTESRQPETTLPFGERRAANVEGHYWNVQSRTPPRHPGRSEIVGISSRVDRRTSP